MHIASPRSPAEPGHRPARRHAPRLTTLVATLLLALVAGGALAHVFKTSGTVIYFDRESRRFSFDLHLNLEAILARIDPEVADTSDSPNAADYNRLRALPPEDLRKAFDDFAPELLAGMVFAFDGTRFHPEVEDVVLREAGDLAIARDTTIKFRAPLPDSARVFTFRWSPAFGKITLRTQAPRARTMHIEVLEKGAESAPMVIDDLEARSQWDMIRDFLTIGFQHIVPKGLDHILFVVGIFLLSTRLKPILTQVTAFTVAHTCTLGLGTLGLVNIPSAIVEPLIAASIVYVAVENILRPTLSPWRPAVVFCFGLLHGLGFAGILKQFGIPEGEFLVGLLSFNVGVELGQLAVITLCFLAVGIWFGRKPWYRRRVVIPGSLVIAAVGGFWFVQRILP